jgi:hypothetical protein
METKICSKCGKELPVSEFSKNSKTKDGLQCQCKSCQKAAHKEKQERVKKLLDGQNNGLSVYTPRELMQELYRRGYRGTLEFTEVHIPINMRDGSLICIGKGNPDWNYSAPHGAGRLMSRSKAKELLDMEEYQESMSGIYTTSVSRETIDEAPQAYKPMDEIIRAVADTVEIEDIIKPIYNFKATE